MASASPATELSVEDVLPEEEELLDEAAAFDDSAAALLCNADTMAAIVVYPLNCAPLGFPRNRPPTRVAVVAVRFAAGPGRHARRSRLRSKESGC